MALKKQRFFVSGFAVDVFADRKLNNSPSPVVVFLGGFPDFAGPNALTTALVDNGARVLQPHIAGSYDSRGLFSLEGAKGTLAALAVAIVKRQWDTAEGQTVPFGWEPDRIALVGHSFGGIFALRCFHLLGDLDLVVFTSAALHYGQEYGCYEVGPEHYARVARSHPMTYRLAPVEEWNGILEGRDDKPQNPLGKVSHVRIIYSDRDKYFDVAKAVQTTPSLISGYITCPNIEVITVSGGGHSLADLVPEVNLSDVFAPVLMKC